MPIYALVIFLSAFLLFLVQPLAARIILPWFGGGASVWGTCLMFFQALLLAGYLYAHVLSRRLKPRAQAIVHIILLALSLAVLPILPSAHWKPVDSLHPEMRIVLLLAATVGLPYLLLSTTGPLLQSWYARANPGSSPYRLYSLSNIGSLLALIGYPTVVEPLLPLRFQAYAWSGAYGLFIVLCGLAAWRWSAGDQTPLPEEARSSVRPPVRDLLLWAGLAFCPSALLVGVTSHITQNISPAPFLWVAPLALYLLSFILTFESARWYRRGFWFPAFIVLSALLIAFLFPENRSLQVGTIIPIFLAGFFTVAMNCHGELYRLRPQVGALTWFYLMIAAGGALGGFFVASVAPSIFDYYYELPLTLLMAAILMAVVLRTGEAALPGPTARTVQYSLLGATAAGLVFLIAYDIPAWSMQYMVLARNFYGVLRVEDLAETETTAGMRELHNGAINHGSEFTAKNRHLEPTTYYGPQSGVGIALGGARLRIGPRHVGVIGLGAGTLAAYGRPNDTFRFYDINPLVIDIAKQHFFYLSDCPAEKTIVLGDARLSLEREPPQNFDVLAVDAFSGDSIPVHLLTIEAFRLYLTHLRSDGVLAIHISNRYLDLRKVVSRAANVLDLTSILIVGEANADKDIDLTDWVILAPDRQRLDSPEWKFASRVALKYSTIRPWTDDYSSILSVLK